MDKKNINGLICDMTDEEILMLKEYEEVTDSEVDFEQRINEIENIQKELILVIADIIGGAS